MFERLLNSLILVLVPHSVNFASPILIGVYLTELITMIVLYNTFGKESSTTTKSKGSVFSYVYQNYVLRQSVNFLTVILIEGLYSMTKAFVKFEGPYQTFVNNKVVTEGVPYTVIGLLLVNMSFNVFCWVWEIKSDRLLEKTKIIWRMMFP